jgi:hypothetical protein
MLAAKPPYIFTPWEHQYSDNHFDIMDELILKSQSIMVNLEVFKNLNKAICGKTYNEYLIEAYGDNVIGLIKAKK